MKIGNIDINKEVLIIAELSANHNGSLEVAKETIRAAKHAGANAIKLQTYKADTITIDCDKPDFIINNNSIWDGKKYYQLYNEASTPWEWHKELFMLAKELDLECFSSPFDKSAIDFLKQFDPPAFKIASFEITDIPLIRYAAEQMKPIIISTGIAEKEDIQLAVNTCKEVGNEQIILLKCTSSYPAPYKEANLSLINKMQTDFKVHVGLSDHTLGFIAPCVAVALGACVVEKHFILDKSIGGPDASFSLEPEEFKLMSEGILNAKTLLGQANYNLTDKQKNGRGFMRSLYVTEDISKGERFNDKNVKSIRPGHGCHPKHLPEILGKISNQDLEKGTRFELDFISK